VGDGVILLEKYCETCSKKEKFWHFSISNNFNDVKKGICFIVAHILNRIVSP
jgi:hypothetical protein